MSRYYHKDGTVSDSYNGNILHREDGPAIIHNDGYQAWYMDDERHREDGPAVIFPSGSKNWYINGVLHRLDGPAIETCNHNQTWYIHGIRYLKQEFDKHPLVLQYQANIVIKQLLK